MNSHAAIVLATRRRPWHHPSLRALAHSATCVHCTRVLVPTHESTVPIPPSEKQADLQRAVAALAAEFRVPIGDVAALYEGERAGLVVGATITKFLHIFAIRNVRETLRHRTFGRQPRQPAGSHLLPA
jgi:hypothetical protein